MCYLAPHEHGVRVCGAEVVGAAVAPAAGRQFRRARVQAGEHGDVAEGVLVGDLRVAGEQKK